MSYMGFVSEARAFAPSKRIGSLLIIVAALVVVVIIVKSDPSPQRNTMRVTLGGTTAPRAEAEEKDTDGDKLKDWEEDLWGLSSSNPDTDGDGMNDSQEVENRRRTVAEVPLEILATTDPDAPKPNPIELAGRILVSQFLTAKSVGAPLTEKSISNVGRIAIGSEDIERSYPLISIENLSIRAGTMSAKEYGNGVGLALLNTSGAPAPSELVVMLTYIQAPDSDKFQQDMTEVINRYNMTIDGLMKMQITSDRAEAHLALINALITVRTDLVDLAKVGDNPLMAIEALDAYQKDSTVMTGLFERLRASLLSSGTVFIEGEPGHAFVNAKTTQ